jgi:hypothetical protein
MRKEFVIRGQTVSTAGLNTEVLNFSGYKPGYAYRLVEFLLYPSLDIGATNNELCASITAGKTAIDPQDVNFNDEALIGTAMFASTTTTQQIGAAGMHYVVNDTFLITQNLILQVFDSGGSAHAVNWQCRFVAEKMSGPEEAVANYKQFAISDE